MNEFAIKLSVQNNDQSLKQTSRETPYEFPYGNIILNLLNNGVPSVSSFCILFLYVIEVWSVYGAKM